MSIQIKISNVIKEANGIRVWAEFTDTIDGTVTQRTNVYSIEGDAQTVSSTIKDMLRAEAQTLLDFNTQVQKVINKLSGWTDTVN